MSGVFVALGFRASGFKVPLRLLSGVLRRLGRRVWALVRAATERLLGCVRFVLLRAEGFGLNLGASVVRTGAVRAYSCIATIRNPKE